MLYVDLGGGGFMSGGQNSSKMRQGAEKESELTIVTTPARRGTGFGAWIDEKGRALSVYEMEHRSGMDTKPVRFAVNRARRLLGE